MGTDYQRIGHETATVVSHRYTVLHDYRFSIDQHLGMLYFYENIRKSIFCGHNILTEGVSVTQLSSKHLSMMKCVGYNKLQFHEL